MDILIITLLIIAAIILFLVEAFFIPGISIAGFAGLGCVVYANFYAFAYMGTTAGVITLIASLIACTGSIVLFMRSKMLDKIALNEDISSKVDRKAEHSIQIGDTGIAVTRLALMGNAEISGKTVEVKSSDGFLDEKTPVIVTRVSDGIIIVEKQTN